MERPASVTLIALMQVLFAGLTLLVSLIGVMAGAVVGGLAASGGDTLFGIVLGSLVAFIFLLSLAYGFLGIVFSVGLLQLRGWGWLGSLVMQALGLGFGLLQLLAGEGSGLSLGSILISGIIIYVLLRPEVKRVFGR
ncbi:hypothetical protein [Thermostichus vulcanus]|uniref:Uncharacterized protein n=1 Tax=Thermostichus vulcanus str. 'Rupite' TaxID=2813851 RepID=A0ABT0CDQ7_THEVL|nr:hypothetical protein [Thermostichus vulcanus]MCJ2543919.1 hypothetical protein [Thermostichus vulcanus str. 'Rupite']